MGIKQYILKVWENLKLALKHGELKGIETNSNYIEFWYWMRFENVKVIVNGEEYGLDRVGKLSKILTNGETVRTVWSKMRRDLKLKMDEDAQKDFKEVYSKDS